MKTKYEKESEILKSLAHPVRLQIIATLMEIAASGEDKCTVNSVQQNLGLPQSTISQHLRLLKDKDIIRGKKDGVKVCYAVTDSRVRKIMKILTGK